MATPFIFVVIQVERETVMIAWRLHWGDLESQINVLSYVVFLLSIVSIRIIIIHIFFRIMSNNYGVHLWFGL